MANFQTLGYLCDHDAYGSLVGTRYTVTALRDSTLRFPAGCTGTISVFCLSGEARGVDISGLHYSLKNGTLTPFFPLGVSNHFTGEEAEISVKNGTLLILWDKENGFPERMIN